LSAAYNQAILVLLTMRTDSTPTRQAASAARATTLMTLVAVAAAVAALPMVRAIHQETRAVVTMEAEHVRTVAAAVVAAARDLLAIGERNDSKPTFATLSPAAIVALPATDAMLIRPATSRVGAAPPTLAERLLDLPPPTC
jgi:hypothetical protein